MRAFFIANILRPVYFRLDNNEYNKYYCIIIRKIARALSSSPPIGIKFLDPPVMNGSAKKVNSKVTLDLTFYVLVGI